MAFKRSAVRSRLSPPQGNRGKALDHNGPGLFPLCWEGEGDVDRMRDTACPTLLLLGNFRVIAAGLAPGFSVGLGLLWILRLR